VSASFPYAGPPARYWAPRPAGARRRRLRCADRGLGSGCGGQTL